MQLRYRGNAYQFHEMNAYDHSPIESSSQLSQSVPAKSTVKLTISSKQKLTYRGCSYLMDC